MNSYVPTFSIYVAGKALLDIGIVPGSDMTPEAALTKMAYVLSKKDLTLAEKRKMMETNLVGEMTVINFIVEKGHQLSKGIKKIGRINGYLFPTT